ncbi:hypothetical protein LTR95_009462 [Oleoguttula sp. CCFEE 5521]
MDPALVSRLHDLSPELFDMIKVFTLQPNATYQNENISITERWQAPSFLQITSASRYECAEAYYGTNIFDFSSISTDDGSKLCAKWFNALPPTHRDHVMRYSFTDSGPYPTSPLDFSRMQHFMRAHDTVPDVHLRLLQNKVSVNALQEFYNRVRGVISASAKVVRDATVRDHQLIAWLRSRLQIPLQLFGEDGVVHDLSPCPRAAATALVAALRQECDKA